MRTSFLVAGGIIFLAFLATAFGLREDRADGAPASRAGIPSTSVSHNTDRQRSGRSRKARTIMAMSAEATTRSDGP